MLLTSQLLKIFLYGLRIFAYLSDTLVELVFDDVGLPMFAFESGVLLLQGCQLAASSLQSRLCVRAADSAITICSVEIFAQTANDVFKALNGCDFAGELLLNLVKLPLKNDEVLTLLCEFLRLELSSIRPL